MTMLTLPNAYHHRDNASGKSALVSVSLEGGERRAVWFPRSHLEIEEGVIRATSWIVSQKEEQYKVEILTDDNL